MKIITLLQPWAWAIAAGHKTIETRTWSTAYRGPLIIHAGKRAGPDEMMMCVRFKRCGIPVDENDLEFGAVVAVADLVDVRPLAPRADEVCAAVSMSLYSGNERFAATLLDVGGIDMTTGRLVFDTAGRFGWHMVNVRRLTTPIPWKGERGLRDAPHELVAAVQKQLAH